MVVNERISHYRIMRDGKKLEQVSQFKYLRYMLGEKGMNGVVGKLRVVIKWLAQLIFQNFNGIVLNALGLFITSVKAQQQN